MSSHLKHLGFLVIFFLGWGVSRSAAADWPAIGANEKSMTSIPQQPDAAAVILYREDITDDTKNFHTLYLRLKVLTEAGRKYADVEIPVGHSPFTISQISGRTVHADGSIVPLEDQPVDKIVVHEHGVRMHVKTFTLPSVQVGSILDYRYSLHFPEGSRNAPVWMVQGELFVKKAVFKFVPTKFQGKTDALRLPGTSTAGSMESAGSYEYLGQGMSAGPNGEYGWIPYLPAGAAPEEHVMQDGGLKWYEMEMSDVPASASEPDVPPQRINNWHVNFFYRSTAKPEDYWKHIGKSWSKDVESFLEHKKGVSEAVSQLVTASDSPEAKLQKIYAAISLMDNRSFALSVNSASVPNPNTAAENVLQARSGTHDELNRLFVAMVRSAGIAAVMMWLPDRGQNVFDPNLMNTDQLEAEVAVVQIGGKDVFLDPGTKFCPYGVLNWHYVGARGLRQSDNGATIVADSPAPTYAQANIQRVARLQLTDHGTVDGTLAVGFSGQEAMVRRQLGASLNADARKKLLEDEIRNSLPAGAQVTLTNAPDWDKTEGMLVAKFKVAGPFASNNGQRWVVPVHFFEAGEKPRFGSVQRTNPVYFNYASREVDEVHIVLPAGVAVENLPAKQEAKTAYALYRAEQKAEGAAGIVASRDMAINSVLFSPAEYKELKDFYDKVALSDNQTVDLKGSLHPQTN